MKFIVLGLLLISLLSCRLERNLINGGVHIISNKRTSGNKIEQQNNYLDSYNQSICSSQQVTAEHRNLAIETNESKVDSIPRMEVKSLSKDLKIQSNHSIKTKSSISLKNTTKKRNKLKHTTGFIISMSGLFLLILGISLGLFSSELAVIFFGIILGIIALCIMFIAIWICLYNLKSARTKKQRLLARLGIIIGSIFCLPSLVILLIFLFNYFI
jgi:cation transport ATPase